MNEAQRIMDKLGFIVIMTIKEYPIGRVLKHLVAKHGYPEVPDANIVIIGTGTIEDQQRQDAILGLPPYHYENCKHFIYKAIAE